MLLYYQPNNRRLKPSGLRSVKSSTFADVRAQKIPIHGPLDLLPLNAFITLCLILTYFAYRLRGLLAVELGSQKDPSRWVSWVYLLAEICLFSK